MGTWASGMMLPDIPRLYTAAAEWLACLVYILQVNRRLKGRRLAVAAGIFLVWQISFLSVTDGLDGFWWVLCMLAAILSMYFFLYISCEGSAFDAGYRCVESFVLAELAASLGWQLYCFLYYEMGMTATVFGVLFLVLIYVFFFGGMGLLVRHFFRGEETLDVTWKEFLLSVFIGGVIFLVSNLSFTYINTPFSSEYSSDIFNIRTLMDLCGVITLFAYHILRINMKIQCELDISESMLEHQYLQYQQSRETLDMINYKYHDLKHQIIALRAEEDSDKRREYLDRMEASVSSYETQVKTGNKVLDIILTSKSLSCYNDHITFTSVVDGSLLDFLETMDICSIFGNALDNAIECEKKIEDEGKRMIHLSVFSQQSFLIVRCENYCEEGIAFEKDLPKTTKKGRGFHGYGLKSIRNTAQKYGGEVDVEAVDNRFSLKILIPLPMQTSQ